MLHGLVSKLVLILSIHAIFSSHTPSANATPAARGLGVRVRREWYAFSLFHDHVDESNDSRRDLSEQEQLEYIRAVKCLQTLPTAGSIDNAKTRFDDFQGTHINLAPGIHLVVWHSRRIIP